MWHPEIAETVIGCKAWGVLVNQFDQVEQQGHDAQALLRGVLAFIAKAHTPAAFVYRSVEDQLDGMVDLGTQSSSDTHSVAPSSATPAAASSDTPVSVVGEGRGG
ncbi:hypothetical protein [Actinoplanes sp. NPDC051494]|uniref:hypothetical protein n=1 Tax=Actinoplanes sp. NPDC051494 TaxID=3363907 RepID=UPI0037AEFFD3